MVADDPESFADLDGHDGVLQTLFRLAGSTKRDPDRGAINLLIGGAKGLANMAIEAVNSVTGNGRPITTEGGSRQPADAIPELALNNRGEVMGAIAAPMLVGAAISGAMEGAGAGASLTEGLLFRNGKANPANLTIREGEQALSFRNSLSDPIGKGTKPTFTSDSYTVVDASKLPKGSAVLDNNPPGHVSVKATPSEVKSAVVDVNKFPKPTNTQQ